MVEVKFRQGNTRVLFTALYGALAILFLAISYVGTGRGNVNAGPIALGFDVEILVIVLIYTVLAARSSRQAVILEGDSIRVRAIFHSRMVPIDEVAEFGLYLNLTRNAWLAGLTKHNGKSVKFPFYARSWVRDDKRNDRMVAYVKEIESMVNCRGKGSTDLPKLMNY